MKETINMLLACGVTVALANGRGFRLELVPGDSLCGTKVRTLGWYDKKGRFYSVSTICNSDLHFVK